MYIYLSLNYKTLNITEYYLFCRIDALYSGVAYEGWCPWDYAAGSIILNEAGGALSTVTGEKFDIYGDSIVAAANKKLADDLSGITSSHYLGAKK